MLTATRREATVWIKAVDPSEASGMLAEIYQRQLSALDEITDFTKLGSLYPALAGVRLDLYKVVDHCPSKIPEWARQFIALLTSVMNRTPHCASGLAEKVRQAGGQPDLVEKVFADPNVASGDEAIDALFDYTRKLVREPASVGEDDISRLREVGWDDLDILDANDMCAYYCYINRVANGLGLKTLTYPAPEIR